MKKLRMPKRILEVLLDYLSTGRIVSIQNTPDNGIVIWWYTK